ncbi:hypothetical protein [Saccharothrix sp. ST-888]|uniref:hypothetical protein n=1 Tax=Saccharothrix sp. ST-888 TaxID=1427391 RepID=UPI000698764F|nr:hypothetical protein [Saccharothrix sp. ST-888]
MSTNRSRRIDRDTAEQLLGGVAVDTSAGQAPLTGQAALAGLLAAAAAPSAVDGAPDANGVLPGEEAALTAFREARRNPAPKPRRRTMLDTAPARAFSAKAVAVAFTATALGGVAVAAGTGHLPAALRGPAGDGGRSVARATSPAFDGSTARSGPGGTASGQPRLNGIAPSSPPPSAGRPGTPGADPDPGAATGTGTGRPDGRSGDESVEAQLLRLCHLYTDRLASGDRPRPLLREAPLAPLVLAAGGADQVDGYCTAVAAGAGNAEGKGSHGGRSVAPAPAPDPGRTLGLPSRFPLDPTRPAQDPKPTGSPGLPGGNGGGGGAGGNSENGSER